MAKITTITNPLTGQPAQVDQLDHTAQQIDDGLNIARGVSNPNLLDNWYFGNPVDQRQGRVVKPNTTYYSDNQLTTSAGTTSAYVTAYRYATGTASGVNYASFKLEDSDTAPTYYVARENVVRGYTGGVLGVDRWLCNGVVISDNGLTFTSQAAYIVQPIEAWKKEALDGKTVTISALLSNGELVAGSNVYTAAPSENVYFAVGKVQLLIQTNGNLLVWADTQATVEAIKLELGSQQTLAHQDADGNWVLNELPNYADTLARCQRYLRFGEMIACAQCIGYAFLPIDMRALPSIIGQVHARNTVTNQIEGSVSVFAKYENGIVFSTGSDNLCYVYIPRDAGLTAEL